jgi:ActR/RegA family two-component response regulator
VFEHIADFIQLRGMRPRDVIVVCRAADDHLVSFETDLLRFSVAHDVCLEETNLLSAILVLRSQSYGTAVVMKCWYAPLATWHKASKLIG